jgi:UDP-N-acetylmuramoylalanine--D-glutamate ligase
MFLEADEIVVSPGVPLDIEPLKAARQKGVPIVSEIELASRYLQGEIVAITGSNGKTTTTTLIGEILKATGRPVQVGGNIGVAMSGLVESSTPQTINVVETSSFQLDGIRTFRPHVGVLLNITPDHLDRYTDFQAYRASKFRLFENQSEHDMAVLNQDDPCVYPPPTPIRSHVLTFSRKSMPGKDLILDGQRVMSTDEVPLRGAHNVENVLAAMVTAACYDVPPDRIAEAVRRFKGVEHRIEFVAKVRGVEFFNDSKATNVDSAIKAVESFTKNILIVLGGKDKGASYAPLVKVMEGRVKHVLLIGTAAKTISDAIGNRFPKTFVTTMDDVVGKAIELSSPGDVVLLSPACASFDMFENYEHRGRVFKNAVKRASNG